MAHDVFISFSNKDKTAADTVCSILEENKIRCWIAPRDITPGTPFAEGIIDGIKGSKVFILIYSANTNHSNQVIKEVDRAVHHGIAIIPLRLEDVPMSKQLEYYVSDVHWLDAMTPPLEKHIKKLCGVVKLLLTVDEVDDEEVRKAFGEKGVSHENVTRLKKRINRSWLVFPAAIITVTAIFLAIWFFRHQSRVRWAREVALPEIQKLIGANDVWRNLVEPYRMAEKAEVILRDDPELQELFSKISLKINVITNPPGAKIFMKEYVDTTADWTFIGESPLKEVRVPIGIFRWMVTKEGYDTVLSAASTWITGGRIGNPGPCIPNPLIRTLDKTGSIPPGMVRVPATETDIGRIGDFFIGKYEVTNREYKTFIDAGGYLQQKYWKIPIHKDGHEIGWEKAMKEFTDQSGLSGPSSWLGGDYPRGEDNYPVSGVSWYEAAAYAEYSGMSLPTTHHWNIARGGLTPMIQVYQLGGFAILAPFSNFGRRGTVPVGSLSGITAYGAYDMAGNVREWCWNDTEAGKVIRGGSWEDNTYEFGNVRQAPAMDRSPRNGIRLALYPYPDSIPGTAFSSWLQPENPDATEVKPVSDDIFKIYREQFSYDPADLSPVVEYSEKSPGGWIREKISFNAAYGGERILAYLFLPNNINPPFQTVIYFPGSAPTRMTTSEHIEDYYEFTMFLSFLVRNGRAVMFPVYKGTFERGNPGISAIAMGSNSYAYSEFLVQIVKDFRRSIDYLQTRSDIDSSRIAFYGMSWGGWIGGIIPAVENRLKASVLTAGGLGAQKARPEANVINYVTRIKIPTLMLNGKYDRGIDSRIIPMYNLLGTPSGLKQLILYDTDHIPPRSEYVRETLNWLDKYLGPVR